jgi:fatty-acyl-CoA synthase
VGSCRAAVVPRSKELIEQAAVPDDVSEALDMFVPLTTGDFLARAEAVYGDRTAVVDEPDRPDSLGAVSYGRLAERARAIAAGLHSLGLSEGARVAVVSQNSARLLELIYAVTMSGRVLVPINFRLQHREVDYIVEHSGAEVLLVDAELDADLATVTAKHRFVLGAESDRALVRSDLATRPWSAPNEDATATINYTSGTTAAPKGVELTHRSLWTNTMTLGLHLGVSDRDVYLHTLPLFHVNGWGMPFVLAGLGVPQVILRKVDGAEILNRVQQHGVTLMCGAPAVLSAVLAAAGSWDGPIPGRDRVRFLCAGAPPPTSTIEQVITDLGWEFCQLYGLTETSPLLTFSRMRSEWDALPPSEQARRLSRAGAPAIGVTLQISENGEVLASTNHALKSYWDNPEESDRALADGQFHTGDGGSLGADGYLTMSDRKKDVIITGGENVSSIEVEDRLFRHPAVAEVAVIGIPDEKWGETIKALVVLAPGAQATEAELIAYCRETMAHYKSPTSVDFVDAIARTSTGKIQKFKLREPYWSGRSSQIN